MLKNKSNGFFPYATFACSLKRLGGLNKKALRAKGSCLSQICIVVELLNVDARVLRVRFDEQTPWWNVVSHQHRENVIGFSSAFDRHFFERTRFRIHGG